MNIEKQIGKIGDLLDELDADSLTEDEAKELLTLTEEITNNIEMAENIPSIIERFKEVNKRSQANVLASKIVEQLENSMAMKNESKLKQSRKQTPLSPLSPFNND